MTNSERRVSLVEKLVEPPGEAHPDWEIFAGVARFAFAEDPAALARQLIAGLTEPDPSARRAGCARAARYTWTAAAQRHLAWYHCL
jgi:anaerobic selenocysteine-containing dehydrogenase